MAKGADGSLDPHNSAVHARQTGLMSPISDVQPDPYAEFGITLEVGNGLQDDKDLQTLLIQKFLTLKTLLDDAKISIPENLVQHFDLPIKPTELIDPQSNPSIIQAFRYRYQMRCLEKEVLPAITELLNQGKEHLKLPKISAEIAALLSNLKEKTLAFEPSEKTILEFKKRAYQL